MAGKNILTSILATIMVLGFLAFPCLADERKSIAVLLSGPEEVYVNTAAAFEAEVGYPVNLFNLQGDIRSNPQLKRKLLDSKPVLILALGAKAAYVAKLWTKDRTDIKVIFAMVLNWQNYDLLSGQDNIAGIAAEIAPATQFVNLTTFVPKLKKIGVIYNKEKSGNIIAQAKKKAAALGLELLAVSVDRPEDFQNAYKQLRWQVDCFWAVNDPVAYSLDNMAWLADKCVKDRMVCLGQSKNISEQGLAFSISTNSGDIGSQAASLAKNIILGHQTVGEIGVMPPLGTDILVNMRTVDRIGIKINEIALDMATEIIN